MSAQRIVSIPSPFGPPQRDANRESNGRPCAWRSVLIAAFFGLIVTATGCATQRVYGFRPAGGNGATVAGLPASRYLLPAEAPTGEVVVAAPEAHRVEGTGEELIHVRLAVSANAQGPAWSLDPNRQALGLPTGQTLPPAYMDAPDGNRSVPFVINPGAQRSLDLFYRLPPGQSVASNVIGFQLNWEVAAGDRVMAMQTPFARETIDEEGPYVAVGVATPWWWYRPYWWGPWGPSYAWGWGYGYGYGWGGWRHPGVYHPWPGGGGGHGWPGAGHGGGGWRGGGGSPVRGAPVRH